MDYSCDSFAGEKSNTGEKGVISYCKPYTIPLSCCKFLIYWVGVNTKFTT